MKKSKSKSVTKPDFINQQLIEKSLQGIIVVQGNRIIYSNQSYSNMIGYSVKELLSFTEQNLMNLIHPDDRKKIADNLSKRIAGANIPPHYHVKVIRKDGKVRIFDLYANRIEYDGKPAVQAFTIDITEQIEAQEYLKQRTRFIETVLNNLPLGISVTEINSGKATFINKEFQEITGWSDEELSDVKNFFNKLFKNPVQRKIISTKIKLDIKEKKPENFFWDTVEIETKTGERKYLIAKNIPLYDQNLMILTVQDVTERIKTEIELQGSLKEKEILLREIHHRVKNNLQTISSLLDLQAETITDSASLEAFRSSQSRIRSMALIHERLYKSENLSRIKAREYIQNLIEYLEATYQVHTGNITLRTLVKDLFLNLDVAIPCGLIINELVSNSMKYAFKDGKSGNVIVSLQPHNNNELTLRVKDDGVGIAPEINFENSSSLGLQLVDLLVKQLNGKLHLDRSNGTDIVISFPKPAAAEVIEN